MWRGAKQHCTPTVLTCLQRETFFSKSGIIMVLCFVGLMEILQQNFFETSFNAREQSIQNISRNLMSSLTFVHNNRHQTIDNSRILHTFDNDIFLNSILFFGILHCAAHARPHRISDLYPVSYYTPFPSYLLGFTSANG